MVNVASGAREAAVRCSFARISMMRLIGCHVETSLLRTSNLSGGLVGYLALGEAITVRTQSGFQGRKMPLLRDVGLA